MASLESQLDKFIEERDSALAARMWVVTKVACGASFSGILLNILHVILGLPATIGLRSFAIFLQACGMIMITLFPRKHLKLPEFFARNRGLRFVLFSLLAGRTISMLSYSPVCYFVVSCLTLLVAIGGALGSLCPDRVPAAQCLIAVLVLFQVLSVIDVLDLARSDSLYGRCLLSQEMRIVYFVDGCVQSLVVLSTVCWLTWRWQRNGPTLSVYITFYALHFSMGIIYVIAGLAFFLLPAVEPQATELPYCEACWCTILKGLSWVAPFAVVGAVGRRRAFTLLADYFERRHAESDGAFIAELLDSICIKVGDQFWVHRMESNSEYTNCDPRHRFDVGRVTIIEDERFGVLLPDKPKAPYGPISSMGNTAGPIPSTGNNTTSMGSNGSSMGRNLTRQFTRAATSMGGKLNRAASIADPDGLSWFPLMNQHLPARDLLNLAHENLRCVEWEQVTAQLMIGAILGGAQPMENMFALSRPVRAGERPDWFVSHSWHDDGALKFAAMTAAADKFRRKHGRWPTLWLDKVCIDQENIGDGLKALPVNVMACSCVFVFCGPTYASRLWCAWELFVLCSFMREDSGTLRERLQVCVFAGADQHALEEFDVAKAHCYDPNEEKRLRKVICLLGAAAFNGKVRGLAKTALRSTSTRKGEAPPTPFESEGSDSMPAAMEDEPTAKAPYPSDTLSQPPWKIALEDWI